MKLVLKMFIAALLLASCGQADSIVEPGPGDTDTTTTTTPTDSDGDGDDDDSSGEVVTEGDVTATVPAAGDGADDGQDGAGVDPENDDAVVGVGGDGDVPPAFVVDEDSENAATFTELAISGLVLSLDEQACADEAAATAADAGEGELNAVISAVQACATPAAIDDFSAELIVAGGAPLPPTEAACVSSRLQSGDEYQPFWAALLEEEPFDFLIADTEVQNRFLDLYTECVSVGRAIGEQVSLELSAPTVGCIDGLYDDREFVRVTIEADLSGNVDDQDRVNSQIASCLTAEERSGLELE